MAYRIPSETKSKYCAVSVIVPILIMVEKNTVEFLLRIFL